MLVAAAACSSAPPEDCVMIGTSARTFSDSTLMGYADGCSTDADCVLLKPMLTCYTGCPRGVRKSRELAARVALDGLSEMVCGAGTCSVNEGCNPVHAACEQSRCTAKPGAAIDDGGIPDAG